MLSLKFNTDNEESQSKVSAALVACMVYLWSSPFINLSSVNIYESVSHGTGVQPFITTDKKYQHCLTGSGSNSYDFQNNSNPWKCKLGSLWEHILRHLQVKLNQCV